MHLYAPKNNKYMKNYKIKEPIYLMHLDANNLCKWTISQKFPVNGFEWINDTSHK